MQSIAFLHQKGGTGKSTLALGSASALAKDSQRVLVLDIDPQGTATAWGERFADQFGFVVRGHGPTDLVSAIDQFRNQFDYVLLDCPPTLSEQTIQTLHAVDRLLIPTRPALPDIWALERLAALQDLHGDCEATVVFNQVQENDLLELEDSVRALGFRIAPLSIPADPALARLFMGTPLPPQLEQTLLRIAKS